MRTRPWVVVEHPNETYALARQIDAGFPVVVLSLGPAQTLRYLSCADAVLAAARLNDMVERKAKTKLGRRRA